MLEFTETNLSSPWYALGYLLVTCICNGGKVIFSLSWDWATLAGAGGGGEGSLHKSKKLNSQCIGTPRLDWGCQLNVSVRSVMWGSPIHTCCSRATLWLKGSWLRGFERSNVVQIMSKDSLIDIVCSLNYQIVLRQKLPIICPRKCIWVLTF